MTVSPAAVESASAVVVAWSRMTMWSCDKPVSACLLTQPASLVRRVVASLLSRPPSDGRYPVPRTSGLASKAAFPHAVRVAVRCVARRETVIAATRR